MNIRLPYITGKTEKAQITQIVSYLRQLALTLQQFPQQVEQQVAEQLAAQQQPKKQAAPKDEESNKAFASLRVYKDLNVNGGINGVYIKSVKVWISTQFTLQSRFTYWDDQGHSRQSFLVSGNDNGLPVLGIITLNSKGGCVWTGTENVTVSTSPDGSVTVKLPYTAYDYFLVQSSESFSVK